MRLVQKSLFHTGYFILENGDIQPAFTDELVEESMFTPFSKKIRKIYGTFMRDPKQIAVIVKGIKKFKSRYGIIPQNLTEELRTGFFNDGELTQTLPRFCYK